MSLRALGATPVALPGGGGLGRLDGVVQHIAAIDSISYDRTGRYLTANVTLWPRTVVFFVSERAYAKLDESQRDALRTAARDAARPTIEVLRSSERNATAQLCGRGAVLATASAADVTALRRALAPVYADLHRDATTRSALDRIDALRSEAAAVREPAPSCALERRRSRGPIPDGVYTNTTTRRDAVRARIPPRDGLYRDVPIRHRLVLRSGDFVVYDTPVNGRTEAAFRGTYSVYRNRIVFRGGPDVIPLGYAFDGTTLTFDDGGKGGYFGARFTPPWTRQS
jgi:hypothetical protein